MELSLRKRGRDKTEIEIRRDCLFLLFFFLFFLCSFQCVISKRARCFLWTGEQIKERKEGKKGSDIPTGWARLSAALPTVFLIQSISRSCLVDQIIMIVVFQILLLTNSILSE